MSFLFNNLGWKFLSLLVAFGLWFMVMSSNSIEISKDVHLEFDLPPNLVIANEIPDRVTFRLSGSKFFLRTVVNSLNSIVVDLHNAKVGPAFYRIERDSLHLPIGVKVLSISPSSINPVLEPVQYRNVAIQVSAKNKLPPGYRLLKLQAEPPTARIKGPRSLVEKISVIKAPAVDLTEVSSNLRWEIPVSTGFSSVSFEEDVQPKIIVEVEPKGSNFRIAGVPLKVETKKQYVVDIPSVALYVQCPPKMIQLLTPEKVSAWVEIKDTDPGIYVREVKVRLPDGVKLVRVVPERVKVQLK